jgi:hypothetical protein
VVVGVLALSDVDVEDLVGVAADVEDAVEVGDTLGAWEDVEEHAVAPTAAPTVNMAATAERTTGCLDKSYVQSPRGGVVGPPMKHGRHLHDLIQP